MSSATSPNARLIALYSATSPTGVDVAWALMWTMSFSARPARSTASSMARDAPAPLGSGAVMWWASADMPDAGELGVDPRAAGLGVLLGLEHDDRRALAEDEAVAAGVVGARGGLGVVVAGRQRLHRGEAGDRQGWTAASVPPATTTSARPLRIMSTA